MNNNICTNKLTVAEYLYKNHGLLNRMILIYEELIRRLKNNIRIGNKIVYYTAYIIKNYVENYHKTNKIYIYPLLRTNNIEIEIIDELANLHKINKQLINHILKISENDFISDKNELIFYMQQYIKISRYHTSREDTVIFPKFINLLDNETMIDYSWLFDEKQNEYLGLNGFNNYLNIIVSIEKYLNIHDLKEITKEIKSKTYYK